MNTKANTINYLCIKFFLLEVYHLYSNILSLIYKILKIINWIIIFYTMILFVFSQL